MSGGGKQLLSPNEPLERELCAVSTSGREIDDRKAERQLYFISDVDPDTAGFQMGVDGAEATFHPDHHMVAGELRERQVGGHLARRLIRLTVTRFRHDAASRCQDP